MLIIFLWRKTLYVHNVLFITQRQKSGEMMVIPPAVKDDMNYCI